MRRVIFSNCVPVTVGLLEDPSESSAVVRIHISTSTLQALDWGKLYDMIVNVAEVMFKCRIRTCPDGKGGAERR